MPKKLSAAMEDLLDKKETASGLTLGEKAVGRKILALASAEVDEEDDAEGEDMDPEAEGEGEDPEAEGEDKDPEAEGEDKDPEAEGEDKDPEAEGEEEDAEARVFAILDHPAAEGRGDLARKLAKNKSLSSSAAIELLEAAPKAGARLDEIRKNAPQALKNGSASEPKGEVDKVVSRAVAAKAALNGSKKRRRA